MKTDSHWHLMTLKKRPNKEKLGEEWQEWRNRWKIRGNALWETGEKIFLATANGSADRVVMVGNAIPAQYSVSSVFWNQALASATASWKQLWSFQPPSTRHAICPACFLSISWRLRLSPPLPAGGEKGRPSVTAHANADSDATAVAWLTPNTQQHKLSEWKNQPHCDADDVIVEDERIRILVSWRNFLRVKYLALWPVLPWTLWRVLYGFLWRGKHRFLNLKTKQNNRL